MFSILVSVWSCRPEPKETPTKGYLKCLVDKSLVNVITEERDTFVTLYKQSKIDLEALTAREGIAAVLNSEAKMFVSSRSLNDEEKNAYEKNKSNVRIIRFCYDGIALIVNEFESIDKITVSELKEMLTGKKLNIKVISPERNSGVYEYIKNDILNGNDPTNVEIMDDESHIIQKVRNSKGIIGVVGVNTLKDVMNIKTLQVSLGEKNILGDNYYEPIPGYLVNGKYPLVRIGYIFINEIGLYVASGFATFITSTDGQKIVLKNNLGPATVPVRIRVN